MRRLIVLGSWRAEHETRPSSFPRIDDEWTSTMCEMVSWNEPRVFATLLICAPVMLSDLVGAGAVSLETLSDRVGAGAVSLETLSNTYSGGGVENQKGPKLLPSSTWGKTSDGVQADPLLSPHDRARRICL